MAKKKSPAGEAAPEKEPEEKKSSGCPLVDGLPDNSRATVEDYVAAASEYVRSAPTLNDSQKKVGQIKLSAGLTIALRNDLLRLRPDLRIRTGEHPVSGALRVVNADLSEFHLLDGLRLAVEIKPVNLAVGRAIWNRFGDIRTFGVNLHLKFPFAVIGGVLTFPTYEIGKVTKKRPDGRKPTEHLIQRAVKRITRAGGRETEGDAPHLLEAIGVVVYDPGTGKIHPTLPPPGSTLRWNEFVEGLARAYESRFEGQEEAAETAIDAMASEGEAAAEDDGA